MELIFATHNPNKLKEIREVMPPHFDIKGLHEIEINEEIPETGDTLEENSLIKARFIASKLGVNCFADDTGLEVKSLNNEPGVYSARYAGIKKNNEANIKKLLHNLSNKKDKSARFRTVIALIIDGKETLLEGKVEGKIITEKRGANGFGYDPVFIPKGYEITFAEMDSNTKNEISHRGIVVHKLVEYLGTI